MPVISSLAALAVCVFLGGALTAETRPHHLRPIAITVVPWTSGKKISIGALTKSLSAAAATWSSVKCANLKITVGHPEPSKVADDEKRAVIVRDELWCRNGMRDQGCYEDGFVAATTIEHSRKVGAIFADVEINGVTEHFADIDPASVLTANNLNVWDLQSILVHELGHMLGLPDVCTTAANPKGNKAIRSCLKASSRDRSSVMYPAAAPGRARRFLSRDDEKNLCKVLQRLRSW